MNKTTIAIALLVLAAGLGWYGYDQSQGFGNQLSAGLTGKTSDKVMMLYIAAAVSGVLGVLGLVRK